MKKVIVASENPVKMKVAESAFAQVFPEETFKFIGIKAESGVPDQPMNDETLQGALNRLEFIKKAHPDADFWISQEGGLCTEGDRLYNRAWIVIADKSDNTAKSSTASFYIPKKIQESIALGLELGHAGDAFFNTINGKHRSGILGNLTAELITRENFYLQPAIIALSELKHQEWYK